MAIVKNVEVMGSRVVATNNGSIELNQNTGELLIRKGGKVVTRIDARGFTYSESDGRKRIFIGAHPVSDAMVLAISKPGIDVISELKNE